MIPIGSCLGLTVVRRSGHVQSGLLECLTAHVDGTIAIGALLSMSLMVRVASVENFDWLRRFTVVIIIDHLIVVIVKT